MSHSLYLQPRISRAPALPDSNRNRCFRLNRTQHQDRDIEVWGTRLCADSTPPLTQEEVVMLRNDTLSRLIPLCRQLTQDKPVLLGCWADVIDPGWAQGLQPVISFDVAMSTLAQAGIKVDMIDFLDYQPVLVPQVSRLPVETSNAGLLSIAFLQLIPYASGQRTLYKEIALGDVVQVIHCWC